MSDVRGCISILQLNERCLSRQTQQKATSNQSVTNQKSHRIRIVIGRPYSRLVGLSGVNTNRKLKKHSTTKRVCMRSTRHIHAQMIYLPAQEILLCNLPGVSEGQSEQRAPTAVKHPAHKKQHMATHQNGPRRQCTMGNDTKVKKKNSTSNV